MPIPSEDVVRATLEANDRDLKIRSAISSAWAEVARKYPERAWWRRVSTLRAVMREQSVDRVLEVVEDDPGLVMVPHHDTASFIADNSVLFRVKKADKNRASSNFPTPLADLFHFHRADLFGHEGFHRVEIVHIFNRMQTALDWIGVVARDGKRVIWSFELRKEGADIIAFPAPVQQPAGKSVIRPNPPAADENQAEAERKKTDESE